MHNVRCCWPCTWEIFPSCCMPSSPHLTAPHYFPYKSSHLDIPWEVTSANILPHTLCTSCLALPLACAPPPSPSASLQALAANAYVRALLIALRLGDTSLLQHAILSTPPGQVVPTAKQLPPMFLQVRAFCGADM